MPFKTLVSVQWVLVLTYVYAVVAYLGTDAAYFPEQSPPGWSWPAVIVVAIGFVPAAMCLAFSAPGLRRSAAPREQTVLAVTCAATAIMLVVMATPPGWELFDWYVS